MRREDLILSSPSVTQDAQEAVDTNGATSCSHNNSSSVLDDASNVQEDNADVISNTSNKLLTDQSNLLKHFSPFWHDRLIEACLVLSMTLYYITGNQNLGTGHFFHLNSLYSLPFLLIFAVLCWYRLSFVVALIPLTLPYYLLQKTVVGSYAFSLTEIALGVCLGVAVLQLLLKRAQWQYWLSCRELRDRLGPFTILIFIFFSAAAVSIVIAYDHRVALRGFRREVLDPVLYLLLVLYCLRSCQDVARLLAALLGTALMVALLSLAQYFFFRGDLMLEPGNVLRVHATYGSANAIGLLLDYTLPIGLAVVVAKLTNVVGVLRPWMFHILAIALCLPLLFVLYLSQSHGAWIAIAAAALFIAACSIRDRKVLLVSALICIATAGFIFFAFHGRIINFLLEGHVNAHGISTATRRIYLWESALKMIHDSPWLGYGMDNWLCHYSNNTLCHTHLYHYMLKTDPVTGTPTGLQDEPTISHPHNILLDVWVSMGLFGLLAFIGLLVLFFWLIVRVLTHLRSTETQDNLHLQWVAIGVGAAMFATLVHGQIDSSFLGQDTAFCFWTLIGILLLLRVLSVTSWRSLVRPEHAETAARPSDKTVEEVEQ